MFIFVSFLFSTKLILLITTMLFTILHLFCKFSLFIQNFNFLSILSACIYKLRIVMCVHFMQSLSFLINDLKLSKQHLIISDIHHILLVFLAHNQFISAFLYGRETSSYFLREKLGVLHGLEDFQTVGEVFLQIFREWSVFYVVILFCVEFIIAFTQRQYLDRCRLLPRMARYWQQRTISPFDVIFLITITMRSIQSISIEYLYYFYPFCRHG